MIHPARKMPVSPQARAPDGRTDSRVVIRRMPDGRLLRLAPEADSSEGRASSRPVLVARVQNARVIDTLYARKSLTSSMFAAAEIVAGNFVKGGFVAIRAAALVERVQRGQAPEPEACIAARERLLADLARCEAHGANIVLRVCGQNETVGQAARAHGIDKETAMRRLKRALEAIASHHGL